MILVVFAVITGALCNPNTHVYSEHCKAPIGYYYPNEHNTTVLPYLDEPIRPIERCCPCSTECKHFGGSCLLKWAYYLYPKCCDYYPVEPCRDYSCVCCISCHDDKCSPCIQSGGECRKECRSDELEDKTNHCSYYNDGSGCKCCKRCEANYECIEAYGVCATDPEWCPYGTYASTGCCGGCYCCKPVWTPVIGGPCDSTDGAYCSETGECSNGYYACFGECFAAYYNAGHSRIEQGYCCVPKNKPPPPPDCGGKCEIMQNGNTYVGECRAFCTSDEENGGPCPESGCSCCITLPIRCSVKPEAAGIYRTEMGSQVFYLHRAFEVQLDWFGANRHCMETDGMRLAEPNDILRLRDYIQGNATKLDRHYWLGGRGNGAIMAWISSGDEVYPEPNEPPVWQEEHPKYVNTSFCLDLRPNQTPGPLATGGCSTVHPFICECL